MNVILFGYRGSGKTTVGKDLAQTLGMTFVDVDQEICLRFGGRSIADIWQSEGEPAFRAMEVRVTKDLLQRDQQVIALGGGTVMQDEAREAIEAALNAKRFYLYGEAGELHRRIQKDGMTTANRPNLTQLGGGLEEVQAVLAKRDPIYRAVADEVIDVTSSKPADVVRVLVDRCRT